MGQVFTGVRARWLGLYEALRRMTEEAVGPFEVRPQSGERIVWQHHASFAEIRARQDAMVVSLASETERPEWQAAKTRQVSKNRVLHTFEVQDEESLPALVAHIAAAYDLTRRTPPARRAATDMPAFATVDEYIALYPPEVRTLLEQVRETIRRAAPEAQEKISWQMPTYYLKENLVHFAAQKSHIGFYPSPEGVEAFADRLGEYKTTKGGIQFPLRKPIPFALIEEITRYRVAMVMGGATR